MTHPSILERLGRLTDDQRAAATAPSGPVLCVAPAGSGKTTTLVARMAWLVDGGIDPTSLAAITFNTRAAEELAERLDAAVAPLGVGPRTIRVRTFHALGREILVDAGADVHDLIERDVMLRELFPELDAAGRGRLDTCFSRLKLDLRVDPAAVALDVEAGPMARAFVAYQAALADRGAIDFDDLVGGALGRLEADPSLLARWRARCSELLVDEVQDVDRSQLALALLLAAPANRIFLVGDDDQSIYGWRLADVRRVLALDAALPGLRRVHLQVNQRCPRPVVERAVRLIAHNEERFAKVVRARAGATGSLILAPDEADEPARSARLLRAFPDDGGTRAILARTNRELRPAIVAALALGEPFRAPSVELLVDDPELDAVVEDVGRTPADWPLLVRIGALWTGASGPAAGRTGASGPAAGRSGVAGPAAERPDLVAALLAWAPPYPDLDALTAAITDTRLRLAALRRDDAALSLATAHSTKGAEFDHVAVVGLDVGRFPSGRAIGEADDPGRTLEEERRLGYVAWTRARRSLTLSYDPAAPSPFLLEAFTPEELGVTP